MIPDLSLCPNIERCALRPSIWSTDPLFEEEHAGRSMQEEVYLLHTCRGQVLLQFAYKVEGA